MGGFGSVVNAFGPEDELEVKPLVKSQNIAALMASLQEAEQKAAFKNEWSIADFTKKHFATQWERQQQANQEADVFRKFHDGRMAATLAADETEFDRTTDGLLDLNLAEIANGRSRGFLGGDVAGSDRLERIAFGLQNQAKTRAARDIVDRKRSNLNWLTGNQVNSVGAVNNTLDKALMRILVPGQLQGQEVARRGGMLGLLDQIDKSNTFYPVNKNRTWMHQLGEGLDGVMELAQEAASIYGSAMGGGAMGGSKPDTSRKDNQSSVRYESMFGGLS